MTNSAGANPDGSNSEGGDSQLHHGDSRRSRRIAFTIIGVGVAAVVIVVAAIVGINVGDNSHKSLPTRAPIGSTVTETVTSSVSPSATPPSTSSRATSSSPSSAPATVVAGAPQGSTPCPVQYPKTGMYQASSVADPAMSCDFAEQVRLAYVASGRPGQLPRSIKVKDDSSNMYVSVSCAAAGATVTCTAEGDERVFLY